jgi:putative ATPase
MPQPSLFDSARERNRRVPLADALRPQTLDDFLGQEAVIGPGAPLRTMVESGRLTSLLFWGPPGVGKTTLARLVAQRSNARFETLSAVSSGIKELREVVAEAEKALGMSGQPTVLFIDEIHRYSKTQQDALLPHVEHGTITLVGATTENPSFQVIPALLSRLLVLRLDYLSREHIGRLLKRAVAVLGDLDITQEAVGFLIDYANGDGRSALTLLDAAYACAPTHPTKEPDAPPRRLIRISLLEQLAQQNRLNYDRQGDEHYDHASAYQKSLRGSDPDAALYWLAKMVAGGEDPRFIARRLVITASEDVGLADPMAMILANTAADIIERVGMPEGRIPLATATAYVARAPKSNRAYKAIDTALSDIQHRGKSYPVPKHLRDAHYSGAKDHGHGVGYRYSHDAPDAPQDFLPPELVGTRYLEPEPSPDKPQ